MRKELIYLLQKDSITQPFLLQKPFLKEKKVNLGTDGKTEGDEQEDLMFQ